MTTETKHKSCPFCGSERLEFTVDPESGMFGKIECEQCHTMGPVVSCVENVWQIENAYWRLEAAAWKAWDTREMKSGTETRT